MREWEKECLVLTGRAFARRYHLKDVIVGKIYFLLVRIKIKHMEIDIIKRETTGTGPNVYHENDTIAKYEIMDGAPVRGNDEAFYCLHWAMNFVYIVSSYGKLLSGALNLLLTLCCRRGVHPHQAVSSRLRDDAYHEGYQQEVLGAVLPQPGPH